jgi:flagellar M-ring protein FliF
MDLLKQWMEQLKAIYQPMSATERVTIVLSGLLVMGGLLGWIAWSSAPEYVPVVYQQLSPEESGRIVEILKGETIPYKLSNGQVLVPRRYLEDLRIKLAQEKALPTSSGGYGFADLVDASKFPTPEQRAQNTRIALQNVLGSAIGRMPSVAVATVILTSGKDVPFKTERIESRASVWIEPRGRVRLSDQEVQAIRSLVTGAVQNLSPSEVRVTDNLGNDYSAPEKDPQAQQAGTLLALKHQYEEDYESKAVGALAFLGTRVHAVASVALENRRKTTRRMGPVESGVVEREVEERTVVSGSQQSPEGISGTGVDAVQMGGAPRRETEEHIIEKSEHPQIEEVEEQGIGIDVKEVSVAVSVPYEKSEQGEQTTYAEPDAAKMSKYRDLVMKATNITDPSKVAVEAFAWEEAVPPTVPVWQQVLQALAAQRDLILLVMLSAVGFWMLRSLVRRSLPQPGPGMVLSEGKGTEEPLTAEQGAAQRLHQEVRNFVQKDPELSAGLVKRWIAMKE